MSRKNKNSKLGLNTISYRPAKLAVFQSAMFLRLHEQSLAIAAVLPDRSVTKLSDARTLELSDENWMTIERMLPVLDSLKSATSELCSEENVSVSMVFPVKTP